MATKPSILIGSPFPVTLKLLCKFSPNDAVHQNPFMEIVGDIKYTFDKHNINDKTKDELIEILKTEFNLAESGFGGGGSNNKTRSANRRKKRLHTK